MNTDTQTSSNRSTASPAVSQPVSVANTEPLQGHYFVSAYPPFSCWGTDWQPVVNPVLDRPGGGAPIGLYVHLPFCTKKCDFCYFLSYIAQPAATVERYVEAVVQEFSLYARKAAVFGRPVSFAYFGGGTPSTLSPKLIRQMMAAFRRHLSWDAVCEITFECAPGSVHRPLLEALREVGVTRLSMGVQSFDDEILRLNGRTHLAADVQRACQLIRELGFPCVNLDLMTGMLGETEQHWNDTVQHLRRLAPDRVTIYQTEIPYHTRLAKAVRSGQLTGELVSWEDKRARLNDAFEQLTADGYTVVSAYAAAKDPVRHGFNYCEHLWRGGDMLGVGVAAFSYLGGAHFQNMEDLHGYCDRVEKGELPLHRATRLSEREQLVREFILQLKWGAVDLASFRRKFAVEISDTFAPTLNDLRAQGMLHYDRDRVTLTRQGLLQADRLLPLFYDAQYRKVRYA